MTGTKAQCFERLLLGNPGNPESGSWLEAIRAAALDTAKALNFPSERHDDWRFTDLSPLFQHDFHPVDSYAGLARADIEAFLIPGSARLVFVDGCFAPELSDLSQAGQGVIVKSLAECLGDKRVEAHFAQHVSFEKDAFSALNTRFFEDGAFVHVSGEAAAPVHILHVATRRDTPSAIYPRSLVVMEANSRATVIEDYVGLGDGINLSNAVTEVVLKEYAQLQHVRVQREAKSAFHIGRCSVAAAQGSVYTSTSLAFGARVSRLALHVTQRGEGAEIHLNGLALIGGRQIADTHTRIDHAAPRGKSVQLHKCIADGAAHAVFSGKIIVHEGATGTDSAQSSRNLLLSGKAHIDTQPQLEIFNDDVSCKHGATVGQIDADALFFLKSRGLTGERARNLLTHAFAAEIIDRIPVPALVESLGRTMLDERMKVSA
ncbi:MAG: Fe-S cluster assembly protein SufD [Nitrosomonadales bacterium]|nr:Fe-S cluster assembly protein SufD [Nitrosomonadales bacterium]